MLPKRFTCGLFFCTLLYAKYWTIKPTYSPSSLCLRLRSRVPTWRRCRTPPCSTPTACSKNTRRSEWSLVIRFPARAAAEKSSAHQGLDATPSVLPFLFLFETLNNLKADEPPRSAAQPICLPAFFLFPLGCFLKSGFTESARPESCGASCV